MRKSEGGFTSAEATVVVALVLLFSALSIPTLTSAFGAWQARSDAQNVSTVLQSARFRATSRANRYRVAFDVVNNSWSLQRYNSAGDSWVTEGSPINLSSGLSNSGIRLQAGSSSAPTGFPAASSSWIIFGTRGIPITSTGVPTGDNIIYLSGGQATYAATVSLAGRVQLWSFNGGTWVSQ